jgi:hypothetical protein
MDTTPDDAGSPPDPTAPAGADQSGEASAFLRAAVESGRLFDENEIPKLLEELRRGRGEVE